MESDIKLSIYVKQKLIDQVGTESVRIELTWTVIAIKLI